VKTDLFAFHFAGITRQKTRAPQGRA